MSRGPQTAIPEFGPADATPTPHLVHVLAPDDEADADGDDDLAADVRLHRSAVRARLEAAGLSAAAIRLMFPHLDESTIPPQ